MNSLSCAHILPPAITFVVIHFAVSLVAAHGQSPATSLSPVLQAQGDSEIAPHKAGNVYAPEVHLEDGMLKMWYGGQGKDGHDRIHFAQSRDGKTWKRGGVVLEDPKANHVNDPSIVKVKGVYYMLYTRAGSGITDEIHVATSKDGLRWKTRGRALAPGPKGAWDSLLVGRPSVLYVNGVFRMWYDGRKDIPLGAADATAPKSARSVRSVGYATSRDGLTWKKFSRKPIYGDDAGGVHVARVGDRYVMLYESGAGTKAAVSDDGLKWRGRGVWLPRSGEAVDRYGHVTPFLLAADQNKQCAVFLGAASARTWDRNRIVVVRLAPKMLAGLFGK